MAVEDDEALQPERTGLAWVRTLVALAGTWGLIAFHAFHDHAWHAVAVLCGLIALAAIAGAGWLGSARGRQARAAMASGAPVTAAVGPALLTACAVIAAAVAIASTLVTR